MALKQLLFVVCFLLGLSLILFHKNIVQFMSAPHEERAVLAVISKIEGAAEVKNSNQNVMMVSAGSSLRDQDTLTVTGGNPVRVKFNDGLEVEIDGGSIAFFENSDRGIFVNLRAGNFKGIAKGSGNEKVLFVKDGVVLDPLGRNIMQPPLKVEEQAAPNQTPPPSEKPAEKISLETLTDTQIGNSMANLRQPLLKCYAGQLKANPKSKGEIYMSFTIERTGQVSLAKVLQNSFQDEKMTKCVTDVVTRAHFDAFKGDPIVVNYPIYFE